MEFGKPYIAKIRLGTSYGSTALKSLQNDNIPELDLLVREAIQNSSDASAPIDKEHYRVEFRTGSFDKKVFNETLPDVGEILDQRFGYGETDFIEVRDSFTEGLTGPCTLSELKACISDDSDDDDHGNFFKLVFDTGKKQTRSGSGGNWGFGKSVYYRVSKVGIVIFYSRIALGGSKFEERMIATLIEDESKKKTAILSEIEPTNTGRAWWGERASDEEDDIRPVTDHQTIAQFLEIFGLEPFGKTETGTSVIIPYVDSIDLLDEVIPDNVLADDEVDRCTWSESLEGYLRFAIQKWYAPKLHNKNLKRLGNGSKWLRAKVNDDMLKSGEMPRFFQLVQELYNVALFACCGVKYDSQLFQDIDKASISVRNEKLSDSRVGFVSFIKITRRELDGNMAGLSPYTLSGNFTNKDDVNEPIVMFTREPGMVIDYSISGEWSKGVKEPEKQHGSPNDTYIFAFFVPKVENSFKEHDAPELAMEYKNLGGYLRDCEGSDHTDWSDNKKLTIIQKIKYHTGSKVSDNTKPNEAKPVVAEASRLSSRLGRLLMPDKGYGKSTRTMPVKPGGRKTPSKRFAITGTSFFDDLLIVEFALPMGDESAKEVRAEVQSESGTITADSWATDIGTTFPCEIVKAEVSLKKNNGDTIDLSLNSEMTSGECEQVKASMNVSSKAHVCAGIIVECSVPGQLINGKLFLNAIDKRYEIVVKDARVKK